MAVRVLLAALLVLYWSSSRVEGNQRELNVAVYIPASFCYITQMYIRSQKGGNFELC